MGPGGQGNLRFPAEQIWAPENGPVSRSDIGVGQGVVGRPTSLRSLKAPLLNSWAFPPPSQLSLGAKPPSARHAGPWHGTLASRLGGRDSPLEPPRSAVCCVSVCVCVCVCVRSQILALEEVQKVWLLPSPRRRRRSLSSASLLESLRAGMAPAGFRSP